MAQQRRPLPSQEHPLLSGIDPSVRKRAEAAARRAGMSLSEWLNSTIGDFAPPNSRTPQDPPRAPLPNQDAKDVADIHQRLDSITRQIEQISRPAPRNDTPRNDAQTGLAKQLNDAISRLDARLSQISNSPPKPAPHSGRDKAVLMSRLAGVIEPLASIDLVSATGAFAPEPGQAVPDRLRDVLAKSEGAQVGESERLRHIADLLGGPKVVGKYPADSLAAHEMLERGLPNTAIKHLLEGMTTLAEKSIESAIGMSVRTRQRREKHPTELLNQDQSGRTWKFAEILTRTTSIFGSRHAAEQWLAQPAIGLDRRRPIDLLTTPAGVELVEDLLGRIEYGVYT